MQVKNKEKSRIITQTERNSQDRRANVKQLDVSMYVAVINHLREKKRAKKSEVTKFLIAVTNILSLSCGFP